MKKTMSKRCLKALHGSIKKWEKILGGKDVDEGTANCPLCKLYYNTKCAGCPVQKKVKSRFCRKTPYYGWNCHHIRIHGRYCSQEIHLGCSYCKRLAKKELDFLKSLLPSTEQ